MKITRFSDGIAICGDSTTFEARNLVRNEVGEISLFAADPPYGNIVDEAWDKVDEDDTTFARWMMSWTSLWTTVLQPNAAFYVWGGLGKPGFRPFLKYLVEAENPQFQLANVVTWSKKRAYGVKHNYLFTREELAYFVNGPDIKKPRVFNIPLLDTKRGYAGYNAKYPAKSGFYRRTNVWMDITEIMQGKLHPTQKPQKTAEVIINIHTNPGEWVLDPFAGAGTTAFACRQLGRRFIVFEQDPKYYEDMIARLGQ